ncbi:phosphoribosylanthranilate isomerase [Candidatus Pelagibacter sp.]|nr:phosphoribosylanthranilate isomerase [Candidatus Pelagibacter sp.]
MTLTCKICGVSDSKTLEFLTAHPTPPKMIGFICNWPKSKRFVEHNKLKELLKVDKKKSEYVAVLVKPNEDVLERIKDLPLDYYQLYDCTSADVKSIKEKYNKKIIVAITVKDQNDTVKYLEYNELADIILFDSKGYEKSMSFDHQLIKNIKINKELMLAGNIQIEDNLENYKEIADIIDISGGLETSGLKDISKINIFLNKMKQINNEA